MDIIKAINVRAERVGLSIKVANNFHRSPSHGFAQKVLIHIRGVSTFYSHLLYPDDSVFSNALRLKAEAQFKSRTPPTQYEFVDYPGKLCSSLLDQSVPIRLLGTVHGFAIRPAREQPLSVEGQEKALEQTIKWFQNTL